MYLIINKCLNSYFHKYYNYKTSTMHDLINKYQPKNLSDIICDDHSIKETLTSLIEVDSLNILFIGDSGSGKTTFIHILLRLYFNTDTIQECNDNIYYINNLKEQGISAFRQDIKTFVQTYSTIKNKKKCVVIDDIDSYSEQTQQIIRNVIDNYSHKVHFILSCSNIQKVLDSLQSRIILFKLKNPNNNCLKNLLSKIIENENIIMDKDTQDYLIKISNFSYRVLLNYLQKLMYTNEKVVTYDILQQICTHIKQTDFQDYIQLLIEHKPNLAYIILQNIYNSGYTVIDILENLFYYIRICDLLNDDKKYKILPIITKYINIFYTIHEEEVELYFFTYELYNFVFSL
jgi:DNA polymerase III delta prime subunit